MVLREAEFKSMTHREFMRRALGHQRREEMEWHRWRMGICYMVNIQASKGHSITPQDVIKLPMDAGEVDGIDNDTKEALKQFMRNG